MSTDELLNKREMTHGIWRKQSTCSRELKELLNHHVRHTLNASQAEALNMIILKISRIVCGNPNEPDHWNDIAGYARLAAKEITEGMQTNAGVVEASPQPKKRGPYRKRNRNPAG
jgi:hypothetical protein